MTQYVNIALIGHVANGKTTLVEKLSGVCTKRNSSEKKSGRTIQLGYANCVIWKCECGKVTTIGQGKKPNQCCGEMKPVYHTSLVDCPGHHSYVHTAVKGTAVVDCAIVVTDVRKSSLQIQTIEHLAILDILGVKNIIVVQNKIDLVDEKQCIEHYNMLQQELKGTAGENVPIIPLSAQSGKGIEKFQQYFYDMVENHFRRNTAIVTKPVISIIRSFDINKPNTNVDNIKGGVLGCTVIGNGSEPLFSLQDKIEIRPGIVYKNNNEYKHIVLQTEIQSIFSESQKCLELYSGGLYGVGTKLDPSLTKADRLVGCLAGRPEDLPEVITEIVMKIIPIKLTKEKPEKVKSGNLYRLIIGSTVVNGIAKRDSVRTSKDSTKLWRMELSRPVCIINNRCLIYNSQTQLIAFGIMSPFELNNHEIQTPLKQSQQEYEQLLKELGMISQDKTKQTLPQPEMVRENRNMIWSNMTSFCQIINRNPTQVSGYLQQELCMQMNICQTDSMRGVAGLRMYKTRINAVKMQTVLTKFVKENVICPQCKSLNTVLRRNASIRCDEIVCQNCGSCTTK